MLKKLAVAVIFMLVALVSVDCAAQVPQQNIRGRVSDAITGEPLPFSTVILKAKTPVGVTTDSVGIFVFKNIPIGRYDIEVFYIGYDPVKIPEILLTSQKEVLLDIALNVSSTNLSEVVVRPRINKTGTLNTMAVAGGRMLSMEEAGRFAGGLDDPARLAATFAGVNTNLGDNGIVVRGNAPKFLQWKMEDVEIPNPNHFAEVAGFGGGGLTALSTNVLGNSDFFTGAFPAEYGNALSGVFDLRMRTGNNESHEHSVEVGSIGIGVSSEGPFKKGGQSSYIFNYRYSTLALVSPLLPDGAGGMKYQDLSFKLNFPTKKFGTFSVWGIGLIDGWGEDPKMNKDEWEHDDAWTKFDTKIYSGALGVGHRISFKGNAYLKSTLATTVNAIDVKQDKLDDDMVLHPDNVIKNNRLNFVFSSYFNKRYSKVHTNRSGITITGMKYDMLLKNADPVSSPLRTLADDNGGGALLEAYSQSSFTFSDKWTINAGLHFQYLTFNSHYSIEPRVAAKYSLSPTKSLSLSYGLHSRMELINYYFTQNSAGEFINKNLDFTRAHHVGLAYDQSIGENMHLRIEPYFQYIFDVPVVPGSSYSFLNLKDEWFITDALSNKGKGLNYGIDLTFEKFMSKGFYYMFTASFFNARYKGGDNIWRNTRYNKHYIANFLIGKEWMVGRTKRNMFSLNFNLALQGGEWYTPVDYDATVNRPDKEVQYVESEAFSKQMKPYFLGHFTVSYQMNRKHVSHEFAVKMLNATMYQELAGHSYNYKTGQVDMVRNGLTVPNIYYKIEF